MIGKSRRSSYESDRIGGRNTKVAESGVDDNLSIVKLPPASITMPIISIKVSDTIKLSGLHRALKGALIEPL